MARIDDNIFIKLIIESYNEKLEYNVSNFHIINQIYGNQLYQLGFYDKDLNDDLINKIDSLIDKSVELQFYKGDIFKFSQPCTLKDSEILDNSKMKTDYDSMAKLKNEISEFLNSKRGFGNYIQEYSIPRFELRNDDQVIHLEILISPHRDQRAFLVKVIA